MKKSILLLALILGVDALMLVYQAQELSISYFEVQFLERSHSILNTIIHYSFLLFGKNDLALRLPMLIMHVISVVLLYNLAFKYLKNREDSLWVTLIFTLLPGIQSAALLVSPAGMIIFYLLFYLNVYDKNSYVNYLLLFLGLFIDSSIVNFYLGIFVYSIMKRDTNLLIYSLGLSAIALYMYGYDDGGVPSGYFLDNLGLYFAIFSPIIFIYLLYTLYRRIIFKEFDIILAISITTFMLSLIFSFRQNIEIESFAPYLIISIVIMAQTFIQSYHVRLKIFRKYYRYLFIIAILFLLVNIMVLLLHRYLYIVTENPKKVFTYRVEIAKDLANKLKEEKIDCITMMSKKMQKRLQFYGINKCKNVKNKFIEVNDSTKKSRKVTIRYKNRVVYTLNVSKIHNKKNESDRL